MYVFVNRKMCVFMYYPYYNNVYLVWDRCRMYLVATYLFSLKKRDSNLGPYYKI